MRALVNLAGRGKGSCNPQRQTVRIITPCILVLALPGCAAYQQRQLEQAQAQAAAQAANDDAQCRSYGAERGSSVYVQCRMNLDNQRAQVAANDRAIVDSIPSVTSLRD